MQIYFQTIFSPPAIFTAIMKRHVIQNGDFPFLPGAEVDYFIYKKIDKNFGPPG